MSARRRRFDRTGHYSNDGELKFAYNMLGTNLYTVEAKDTIPAGKHQVRAEFAHAGGGQGKGGTATLYYDGKKASPSIPFLNPPSLCKINPSMPLW